MRIMKRRQKATASAAMTAENRESILLQKQRGKYIYADRTATGRYLIAKTREHHNV